MFATRCCRKAANSRSTSRYPLGGVGVLVGVPVGVTVTVASRGVAVGTTRSSAAIQPTLLDPSWTLSHRRPPDTCSSPSGETRVPSGNPANRSPPGVIRRVAPSRLPVPTTRIVGAGVRVGEGSSRGNRVGPESMVAVIDGITRGVIASVDGGDEHAPAETIAPLIADIAIAGDTSL